jgi:hypothetical protein
MIGRAIIKTWSSSQRTVATSSGEAELYAVSKATSQALGVMSLMEDFGIKSKCIIKSDSTAAIGIANREGLGRTRHIRVQHLWLQEVVRDRFIKLEKVCTNVNIADLMTKHLVSDKLKAMLSMMSMKVETAKLINAFSIRSLCHYDDEWTVKSPGLKISPRPRGGEVESHPIVNIEIDPEESELIFREVSKQAGWIRSHQTVRQTLFTPMKVSKGPSRIDEVGPVRISMMRTVSRPLSRLIVDYWKSSSNAHKRIPPSRGWTAFCDKMPAFLQPAFSMNERAEGG